MPLEPINLDEPAHASPRGVSEPPQGSMKKPRITSTIASPSKDRLAGVALEDIR